MSIALIVSLAGMLSSIGFVSWMVMELQQALQLLLEPQLELQPLVLA